MFALVRMARIPCLVAFCCSAAFANMHPTSRSASAVEFERILRHELGAGRAAPIGAFCAPAARVDHSRYSASKFCALSSIAVGGPVWFTGDARSDWRVFSEMARASVSHFCRREDDRGLPLKRKHVLAGRAPLFVDRKTWPKTRGARQAGMAQSSGQHDYQASKRLGSIW